MGCPRGVGKKLKKFRAPGLLFHPAPHLQATDAASKAAALSCKWQGAGTPRGTPALAPGKGCPAEVGLGVLGERQSVETPLWT